MGGVLVGLMIDDDRSKSQHRCCVLYYTHRYMDAFLVCGARSIRCSMGLPCLSSWVVVYTIHMYIQMACKERESTSACFTCLHSWVTTEPRLLPPARLAGGDVSLISRLSLSCWSLCWPPSTSPPAASFCIYLYWYVSISSLSLSIAFYKKYGSSTLCSLHGMVTPSRHSYSIRNHIFIPFNFKCIRYFLSGFSMCIDYSN